MSWNGALFALLSVAVLLPGVPTWAALGAGVGFALFLAHPFPGAIRAATTPLLQVSIVGLGAAMDLGTVLQTGASGIGVTLVAIVLTVASSLLLSWGLKTDRITSLLLGVGTAVCGGSAIAAVAPVIGAKPHQTSVSLAVVFLLNAVALLVFPPIGRWAHLEPASFGLWSALAIHDTSSVVGASMQFGETALQVGTTVKLTRALWIVPLTLVLGRLVKAPATKHASKKPWFMLGFIAAAALVTLVPEAAPAGQVVAQGARRVLSLTLFFIGSGVSRASIQSVGIRPLLVGVILWALVSTSTFLLVRTGILGAPQRLSTQMTSAS